MYAPTGRLGNHGDQSPPLNSFPVFLLSVKGSAFLTKRCQFYCSLSLLLPGIKMKLDSNNNSCELISPKYNFPAGLMHSLKKGMVIETNLLLVPSVLKSLLHESYLLQFDVK